MKTKKTKKDLIIEGQKAYNDNIQNFKLEVNRLIEAYKFDFQTTFVQVNYIIEEGKPYIFFFILNEPLIGGADDQQISYFYPPDFVFGNISKCLKIEQVKANNNIPLMEFEGFFYKIDLNEGEKKLLKQLKMDSGKLKLVKYKIKHGLATEIINTKEVDKKISVIDSFLQDFYDQHI